MTDASLLLRAHVEHANGNHNNTRLKLAVYELANSCGVLVRNLDIRRQCRPESATNAEAHIYLIYLRAEAPDPVLVEFISEARNRNFEVFREVPP